MPGIALQQFKDFVDQLFDACVMVDDSLSIVAYNEHARLLFQFTPEEVVGKHLNVLIPPMRHEKHNQLAKDYLAKKSKPRMMGDSGVLPACRKDGTEVPCELSLSPFTLDGKRFCVVLARDASVHLSKQQRMQYQAEHDWLTKLPNRQALHKELDEKINQAVPFALLFLDVDKFKPVNDAFGHKVGDWLLCAIAKRLLACVRKYDMVARIGGDEFVILLKHSMNEPRLTVITQSILDSLARPFHIDNHRIQISASIGIVTFPTDGQNVEVLLDKADDVMYAAKKKRNTFSFTRETTELMRRTSQVKGVTV
jgi:diguanylate cyclase (GGDEF)-like protein/PAS domain S-box-containing protein